MADAWQMLPRWVLAAVLQQQIPQLPSLKMSFSLLPEPVSTASPSDDKAEVGVPVISLQGPAGLPSHVQCLPAAPLALPLAQLASACLKPQLGDKPFTCHPYTIIEPQCPNLISDSA